MNTHNYSVHSDIYYKSNKLDECFSAKLFDLTLNRLLSLQMRVVFVYPILISLCYFVFLFENERSFSISVTKISTQIF